MKHSKSSIFLMEMILCILFFALSSAVCVQLFVKSRSISNNTIDENHAVIVAENLAEGLYAYHADLSAIADNLFNGNASLTSNTLSLYYDSEWIPVRSDAINVEDTSSSVYCASLLLKQTPLSGENITSTITVVNQVTGNEIIHMDVDVHIPHHIN